MLTIASHDIAQYLQVFDRPQTEIVKITSKKTTPKYLIDEETLEDLIDGALATEARKNGKFLTVEESKALMDKYR